MPRLARLTAAGLVYHVTHRGNRQGPVFFEREDRESYLRGLAAAGSQHGLEVWAYCLMTNHVHLLVRALERESLSRALREVEGGHALRVNRQRGWSGHLWASRFYSCPVVGEHLWAAVRYIERNPVRAGLTERAEEYPWASAAAHCGLEGRGILSPNRPFPGMVQDWAAWLEVADPSEDERIRAATRTGRAAAGPEDCDLLAIRLGRSVTARPKGRPQAGNR